MTKRRSGAAADFEEVQPNLFIIHNPALRSILRGEGEITGDRFLLTSPRREGLLARLRSRTFIVRTIDDLLAYLPGLPEVPPPGPPIVRVLASGERFSWLGGTPPAWQPIEPMANREPPQVELLTNTVVRRKRNRGAPEYLLVGGTQTANLYFKPLGEDLALLHAYAQLASPTPPILALAHTDDGFLLPDIPLPGPYTALLRRLATKTKPGWQITAAGLAYIEAILARLQLQVNSE
jgi:hypothetical protein